MSYAILISNRERIIPNSCLALSHKIAAKIVEGLKQQFLSLYPLDIPKVPSAYMEE